MRYNAFQYKSQQISDFYHNFGNIQWINKFLKNHQGDSFYTLKICNISLYSLLLKKLKE